MKAEQTFAIAVCVAAVALFGALGFVCHLFIGPAHGRSSPETAGVQTTTERDGQHDFDFVFGRWKIHLKRRTAGSSTWTEFDGYGLYQKVWDGRANLNEFEADGPNGHIEGLTLRTYNPKTHQWSLYWANSRVAYWACRRSANSRSGEFYAQDMLEDKSILVRFDWTGLKTSSPHFEHAFSNDGSKTWEVNWITDQTRIYDASIK